MIDRRGSKKTTRQSRVKKAREQYMNGASSGRDSKIVKSIKSLFKPKTQQDNRGQKQSPVKSAGSFSVQKKYGSTIQKGLANAVENQNKPILTNRKSADDNSNLPKLGGGQFAGASQQARDIMQSYEPKTLSEYAQNAAKADTANDTTTYSFYNDRRVNQNFHDEAIAMGQSWMTDQEKYTDWILSAPTPEESNRRIEIGEEYFKTALHEVPTYDPSTQTYSTQNQFRADADLPPWIEPTGYNQDLWEYYTTYSHDVVQSAAQAYLDAKQEDRERIRNPYKSAFAASEEGGQVDSFLDVLITSFDPKSVSMTYENTVRNTASYLRDYYINPIKTGHLKTAAGNALWNLMDTMDVASRGVRGLVAGETALGGTGIDYITNRQRLVRPGEWNRGEIKAHEVNDAKFEGQDVYWAQIDGFSPEASQRAQELFMRNGGYELLMQAHPNEASKKMLGSEKFNRSREELEAELDMMFKDSEIDWRDIYNDIDANYFTKDRSIKYLKQGLQNVKKAYTDVDASFNADTGNLATDIVLETVLDPGMIAGGISKSVASNSLRSAAENGVENGFAAILRNADDARELMSNKNVRQAVSSLIRSNEGKNIIFKDAKKFDEDIELFIRKVGKESPIFSTDAARNDFKRAVTAHLMGKNTSVNGAVISAQNFARNALDRKTFKAAYYMDKAIDGVDSAIVKSSFFLPWAGVKGAKALGNGVLNSELLGKAAARLNLRKANAVRTIIDDATGRVDVTKVSDLMDQFEQGIHRERDVREAFKHVVDQYDDVAWNINNTIRKFSKGELTDEEALRLVGQQISDITGGKYKSVQELAGYVDSVAVRYAGDIKSAYGRIDDTFRRLQNLIDRRSESAVTGFIDEVRQAKDINELGRLFRENMDNSYIMALRNQVIDNAQFTITEEELENLITGVRTGLFSDESVTKETIAAGVKAGEKITDKTIRRTISFQDFDNMLRELGVHWETVVNLEDVHKFSPFESKMSAFMSSWSYSPKATYNIDDVLKYIDRCSRQIHIKELISPSVESETSALLAHKALGQFNALRQHVKGLDVISLKDVKTIILPQMDRMAMNLNFRNKNEIQNLYGSFFDDVIAPSWAELRKMNSDEIDLMDSSFFADVDELVKYKYGFDRTSQLIEEAKTLPGFSDDHLHSFLNTLATDFRFRDNIGNIDLTPGGLRRKVEATLRAQTGESKLGMKNITDALQSVDSDNPSEFLKNYLEEFNIVPGLRERYDKYVQTDVLDPRAYVEKQMLFTALADPSVIPEWNRLAEKGQPPIAMHINSTGLNNEINSVTSVSFRKWVPIDITDDKPLTLERLLDAMDSQETTVIQRYMTDDEIGELTEQVIRKLDMKDCSPENVIKRYKEFYGVSDKAAYKSEAQVIEEACAYLGRSAIEYAGPEGLRSVAPTLLVHDLDGFNINYFNNKASAMALASDRNSKTYDYLSRVAQSARDKSCNTYTRLAGRTGDLYYTDEQLDLITELLHDYIDDINHFANGYKFNDVQSYSRKLHDIVDRLGYKAEANELTEQEAAFLDKYNSAQGRTALMQYDAAVRDVTSLGLYPRQFAFTSSGMEENLTKAVLDATGRTSVNTGTRIYVDDILSYFNLETEDGFYASVEDLRKMHDMAHYISQTRNKQIVAGADEFLNPYKAGFDRVIQSVIDIAKGNSFEATQLAYLQNMKIPDNAIDSYLMAKKLYNDHLKYWLDTDELTSLRTGGKDLDAAKTKLVNMGYRLGFNSPKYRLEKNDIFKKACDYINDNRTRFFDELTAGGFDDDINVFTVGTEGAGVVTNLKKSDDILDLLQGAHEPEIFNWAARSDYEKRVVSYRDGVMKSGLDKAAKYSEVNSQLKSEMRQLQHMDEYFANAGILKRRDRLTASVYTKTEQLFDTLEQSGFLKRESFHDLMQKASRLQRLHLQQYRLNSLRNAEGVFDRTKLLGELVYNGFNMSVFNSHNYSLSEMRELREFVEGLQRNGDDFLSYYEDRTTGNIFIYLNNKCQVAEADGARWINQTLKFERPVHDAIPFAEFDELVKLLDIDDIEDFRGVYTHLRSCWEDTRLLSMGQINGTTGRTVNRAQAESFLQSLPSNMNDWLTSEGLLRDEITRGVIYDPGFVISDESDMLTDFLGTLQRQAETAKDDCILINEVFNSHSSVQFKDLAQNFTTEELIDYFGENPEYVVCTITEGKDTATGLQVKQLNLSNKAGVEAARNMPNTTILPYSTYYEIANYMNRDVSDNVYKRLLGKYMLVYKAFALVTPGTWMRNYIDATMKAGIDNGEGVGGIMNMLQYEGKAARDIGTYGRILASDPSLLTPANWDLIQRTYNTDMTFEDFELLRGVMDSDRYTSADKLYLSRTARQRQGFNVISGENIGLRNLEDKDISEAFEKYLAKEPDLPLSKKEFLDIYTGAVVPDSTVSEQYEEMFMKLSNNLRNGNASSIFNKTVDGMFKPFGTVEELVRYAQTLQLRDNGFSPNQITRHIHNTQFYNAPTWGVWNKLETIMPFITFKYNNMMYWVKMMDQNPRFFRYFEDMYRSVYETSIESALEEGVELDYESDYGLQSGGIPIGNGKYYFNIGNSFLSAMNDFYGISHDIDSLNPLLKVTARGSMYALGLGSKEFFSTLDLDLSDESAFEQAAQILPGYSIARKATRAFKNIRGISTEEGGPSLDVLYSTLNFLGVLGVRYQYRDQSGRFSMDDYQEDLARQGKWYDANLGEVVDISHKNEYGANDPNNSFDDVQTYMLVHFGKLWDANQRKFVTMDQYQDGGYNDGFDFENDPQAWNKLCAYMKAGGKVWDYNQKKFVYPDEFISGGLNASGLEWDTIVALTEEKFPNLKWDANQQAFVERRYYISGGLNDVQNFREVMGLREALYGETYNRSTHKFEKTGEPRVVLPSSFMDLDVRKKYDNYYALLAIPHINISDKQLHVTDEGLLMTSDGQYVLTGNPVYDDRIFNKFKQTYAYAGRTYNGQKNYSYNKTRTPSKPYKGRSLGPTAYQTGYGWNDRYGYFREAFEYSYQYHSPQPASKLNRLISPPTFYPYGGGYGKFSFQNRY